MGGLIRGFAATLVALAIVGVPAGYACLRNLQWRNFHVVESGRLYRSGQLEPSTLQTVVDERGIRTIVCLRALARPGDLVREEREEIDCRAAGLNYVRLEPADWAVRPDGARPAQANVDAFLRIVRDPKSGPVLIHCFAGLHRTGIFCAIYRIEIDGWTADEAIGEMFALGCVQPDPDALAYLREIARR